MRIINRYITVEIIKNYCMVLMAVCGIYLIADFFEKADRFVKHGIATGKIIGFFIYNLPFIIVQFTPVGFLLSVLILLGLMAKKNEITALKASGVSIYRIARPILSMSLLFSIGVFIFYNSIVPGTLMKANEIWIKDVKNKKIVKVKSKNVWLKEKDRIIHIDYYDPDQNRMFGLTVNDFTDNFTLRERIDAEIADYEDGKWTLRNVLYQYPQATERDTAMQFFAERRLALELSPEEFKHVIKKPEEMSFTELLQHIRQIEEDGYDATRLRVDLHAKIAFPLVCVILGILGTGIALRGNLRDGLMMGVVYGIGIAFVYWIFHSYCLSLGYGEILPPFVAAWCADFIFATLGIYVLLSAE